jgi:hypothetical protein
MERSRGGGARARSDRRRVRSGGSDPAGIFTRVCIFQLRVVIRLDSEKRLHFAVLSESAGKRSAAVFRSGDHPPPRIVIRGEYQQKTEYANAKHCFAFAGDLFA